MPYVYGRCTCVIFPVFLLWKNLRLSLAIHTMGDVIVFLVVITEYMVGESWHPSCLFSSCEKTFDCHLWSCSTHYGWCHSVSGRHHHGDGWQARQSRSRALRIWSVNPCHISCFLVVKKPPTVTCNTHYGWCHSVSGRHHRVYGRWIMTPFLFIFFLWKDLRLSLVVLQYTLWVMS